MDSNASPSTGEGRPSALVRWGYPLLGALLVALYARTAAPGPTFSDGPEIVTGIVTLGVIHPTGYPLFTLVAHLFVKLVPLDVQPCVKVSLFNALCAGAAGVFTAHVTRSFAWLVRPSPEGERRGRLGSDIAGLFAGAVMGASPLVWDQVRIPEVYAFHLFLSAWALYAVMRFEVTRKAGFLVMAALAMGLGLAHHVTMVYMLPATLIYVLVREPSLLYGLFLWPVVKLVRLFKKGFFASAKIDRLWVLPAVLVVGFLPAFFYYYLLWADKHTVGLNWGGIKDWDGLTFHMMGKQYNRFMAWKDWGSYLWRISRLPDVFDRQFLTLGTVLLVPGAIVGFRRAWRPALLIFLVVLFFLGHGVYYSVGDYQAYFLPADMGMAAFLGVGLDWILGWAERRAPDKRVFLALALAACGFLTAAGSVVYYDFAKRLPNVVARHLYGGYVIPLALVGLAFGAAAFEWRRRANKGLELPRVALGDRFLPRFLLAWAVVPMVPVIAARVGEIDERQVIGDSYGREIMENAPPGSIVMVQGDGYLFTLWYQTHVMNRGTDAAIIDVGTLGAQWYKRYLTSHYPAPCDPLLPAFLLDHAAYEAKCKTWRQRMDLGATSPWFALGERRGKGITAGEKQRGLAILKDRIAKRSGRTPLAPRADARCEDAEFRKTHSGNCRCWTDPQKAPTYSEDCVFSADEDGLVPRERVELWMQHIVEEHIDERPVFERNLFTHWNGNAHDNVRGWSGPDYQRISGEFALVNRGRANQVLYATEVSSPAADACSHTRAPLSIKRPAVKGPPKDGRPYVPNDWPTLLTATYLSLASEDGDDHASRSYKSGDEIRLHIDWFEGRRYDYFAEEHKGALLRHGVRVCVFDGSGNRVAMKSIMNGNRDPLKFKLADDAPPGDYHIAACNVGEMGDDLKVLDDMPCRRLILEYPFKVDRR
jgi:hypothetical protein